MLTDSLTWKKYLSDHFVNITFPIPIHNIDCHEIHMQLHDSTTSYTGDFVLPKSEILFNVTKKHITGYYFSNNDCSSFMVQTDTTGITNASITMNGVNVSSNINSRLAIYYR